MDTLIETDFEFTYKIKLFAKEEVESKSNFLYGASLGDPLITPSHGYSLALVCIG